MDTGQFTVTYRPNGGIGGSEDTGIVSGTPYTIQTETGAGVSRPSYTFAGWNTAANGAGTLYQPGQVVTAWVLEASAM